jgi:protein TonB
MNTYDESSSIAGKRGAALGIVILLHVVVGFGFYTGLTGQILKTLNPSPFAVTQVDPPKEAAKLPPPLPVVDVLRAFVPQPEVPVLNVPSDEQPVVTTGDDLRRDTPPRVNPTQALVPTVSTDIRVDPKHPLRIGEEYYPDAAKRANEQGKCVVRITVAADGHIGGAAIQSSSGFQRLDEACLNAVRGQRMVPATEDGKPVEKSVTLPIAWKLDPH